MFVNIYPDSVNSPNLTTGQATKKINMLVKIYNQKGEETGQVKLPKEIFEVALNKDLVHQVVVSQAANRRQGSAHTKTRAEVRGGGKKPWRQKGTGRARAGSIRSPIWRGGGVTFGPTNKRVFKKSIPKKIRQKALLMALSSKVKNRSLILLNKLEFKEAKTKEVVRMIEILKSKIKIFKEGSILIVLPEINKNIILSARNIPKVKTIQAKELNALDLLSYKYLIILKKSIEVIKETFTEKKSEIRNSKS